eukprot:836036-Prymnesium_polylepis.3
MDGRARCAQRVRGHSSERPPGRHWSARRSSTPSAPARRPSSDRTCRCNGSHARARTHSLTCKCKC